MRVTLLPFVMEVAEILELLTRDADTLRENSLILTVSLLSLTLICTV